MRINTALGRSKRRRRNSMPSFCGIDIIELASERLTKMQQRTMTDDNNIAVYDRYVEGDVSKDAARLLLGDDLDSSFRRILKPSRRLRRTKQVITPSELPLPDGLLEYSVLGGDNSGPCFRPGGIAHFNKAQLAHPGRERTARIPGLGMVGMPIYWDRRHQVWKSDWCIA